MTKKASLAAALAAAPHVALPLTGAAIADLLPQPESPVVFLPPDRLSVDVASPHFDDCYKRVGVRIDGEERRGDVQEYCVSEGWIMTRERNAIGKFKINREGEYVLKKIFGTVVAYFKDRRPTRTAAPVFRQTVEQATAALSAAEAKRQRKATKLREKGL